ncbi:hypothetical protein A3B21_02690 [Candidatus Uhrbacteria bacterium RIFCSPLOWO2_01_FULL_47_24]|uniref:Uncharacterized protein n=1 Tax=Candidatus Uhrbacteria bacterium RIFCSPLOWO2_01_FULL_47_24 TaxID=1802401 RepID=A0A1F7USA1_9BACT|nr:MAG: hypothetical protein A3B21_02690 [Candidatus Uhrbacteria bacterium RIFCSPLOWO2_01_FULL_47_24]OGL84663.1 MAG: hypothetical protein A3J03_02570 [Candidatus Uhrbacteria bacterium RIFCSPLOWO2_02_FULL_46_25]
MAEDNIDDMRLWLVIILIVAAVFSWRQHREIKQLKNEVTTYQSLYENASSRADDYADALQEANNNIEEAQDYSGGSYDEMEEALENLSTVSEP